MKRDYPYARWPLNMAQLRLIVIPAELDDADVSPAAFRLLCHLVRKGAAKPDGARGSIAEMAFTCRMSVGRVKLSLRQLLRNAWISRTSRPGFTSIYRANIQSPKLPGG